jgi:cardiolipin synthase
MAVAKAAVGRVRRRARESRYPWWIVALSLLGGVAVAGVIVTLFFSLGRRPENYHVTEATAPLSLEFLRSAAGNVGAPLRRGGSARVLDNGDFFPALLAAIHNARHTINVSVYIWEPGRASDDVFRALLERARAGVQVRVLLDGFGCSRTPKEGIEALRAAGGKVETFRSPRLGKFTRFHKRNHRRAIVMDGVVAFTGGAGIADKWLGQASNEKEWRDFMVEVHGPPAATVQAAFAGIWAHSTGEILSGPDFFPEEEAPPGAPGEDVVYHIGVASSPSSENHPLRLFFIQTFSSARKRLYITASYFVPEKATRLAVATRARQGVDVRILLPDEHTDATLIRLASRSYYEELLEAGVRIYEYQATMLHSKAVVVDGIWSVVGSANLDIRSKELNEENVLGIWDAGFARQLETDFMADLRHAKEIRLEEWRRRSSFERLSEWVASRGTEQY